MGMYDNVVCRYPLPGKPPAFCAKAGHVYQSKSLECRLSTYEIAATGELRRVEMGFLERELKEPEAVPFQGVLEFYDGNTTACAFEVSFTANGEDSEWVAYKATFVNGIVQSIVETERERGSALARHLLEEIDAKFDKGEPELTMTEPEIGQPMYLQFGLSKGFAVTFLAKTQREWAVADEKGSIHKLHPFDLGRLLFHSQEESDRHRAWRKKTQELKCAYAKELLNQNTLEGRQTT